MKSVKVIFSLIFLFFFGKGISQQTISDSIFHDGGYRSYILYVPAVHSQGQAAPLVLNFHGYTNNAQAQMVYGDFRSIADTAGFLVVHPMGTLDDQNQPYWNAGWGGTVDDVSFTEALIDSISAAYSINQQRVYSTGMSNGGFFSYYLACELGNRIAAIASVTGSMNAYQNLTCTPDHPTPVMQIHGTADAVVPYAGNTTMMPIDDVVDYWVSENNCDATPDFNDVPNTNITDGCTAEHYVYDNGTNGTSVELYKVLLGQHTWPGAPVVVGTTNYDFDASTEIWRFFSKYNLNGLVVSAKDIDKVEFDVFPNPVVDELRIQHSFQAVNYKVYDMSGRILKKGDLKSDRINCRHLHSGQYVFALFNDEGRLLDKEMILVKK